MKKIIDAIFYINLAHRTDRRAAIEEEIEKLLISPKTRERIEAVHIPTNGHLGCCESHIIALDQAAQRGAEYTLILEDDAQFTSTSILLPDCPFDVFMLGANILESEKIGTRIRVKKALCSHAYVVAKKYIPRLLNCFEQAAHVMRDHYFALQSEMDALDKAWHTLQENDLWLCDQVIAQQAPSYSDIYHQERNRTHKTPFAS